MPEVENPPSKIVAQPLALALGAALLLGYAIATGYAVYERSHRASIELADAGNAVGDKTFFPSTFDPALPLVNFNGHSRYFLETGAMLDTAMVRVGMDDTNTYAIYKVAGGKGAETDFVYLKIGPSFYAKVAVKN